MTEHLIDWSLLLGRWIHITTAVCWIGTSIFFMWMDRSFVKNHENNREGHVGDLWKVHGGGFYKVEKMLMGPPRFRKFFTGLSGRLIGPGSLGCFYCL